MAFKRDISYHDIPFASEIHKEDFFLCDSVRNLHAKSECNKNKIIKIRTVGIFENKYGHFYIKQINTTHDSSSPTDPRQRIEVSLAFMSNSVRCCSLSYPVQLFGRLQWCGRPVIFAQIIQPLSVSVATLLHNAMATVSTLVS